jgi:hypothetical protein
VTESQSRIQRAQRGLVRSWNVTNIKNVGRKTLSPISKFLGVPKDSVTELHVSLPPYVRRIIQSRTWICKHKSIFLKLGAPLRISFDGLNLGLFTIGFFNRMGICNVDWDCDCKL